MSNMYYTTKLEFTYSNSRAFNSSICSLTPKSHVERVKTAIQHIYNKIADGRINCSFENAKVTVIAHNNPNFKCKFANEHSLLHTENLIHANTQPSVLSIYYVEMKKQNQLIVLLYLPDFTISNCRFVKT